MRVILCLALVAFPSALAGVKLHPLSDEFIDRVNSKQSTWKAGRNFGETIPVSYLRTLTGVLEDSTEKLLTRVHEVTEDTDIPESFDAREKWTKCASIGEIRDQGACGSCWAVAAVEAMTDRLCIHSDGEHQESVSSEDLLSCCDYCGSGCNGGVMTLAWHYWLNYGIVTGGEYGTTTGCKSYSIEPCAHHINSTSRPSCSGEGPTPACVKQCDSSTQTYNNSLTLASSVYSIEPEVSQIQLEILNNGPVEASFAVYEDFVSYKSGVYQYVEGDLLGSHAIKILGWGVENDTPYWLIANSWNGDWGDNGYFKILRGSNHVKIESHIVAGLPLLE
ncbi:hypothetical protein NQ317_018796 [Molorchus minor]|uniref:Peptidase C1A papain C-terminal domain-containing protein n=1 Tax=Molorchus minor TaxID=1323400 RepID=A0ABQ9ITL9_9CUCU|nr:hypothetical protein NQ317_018796 [Molorchus minor]